MSLCSQTAHQLHTQLKNRNITATQILSDVYDRIKQVEDQIGGYITLAEETAFEAAGIIDQRLQNVDQLLNYLNLIAKKIQQIIHAIMQ
mgnify:CR=1 FL=1